MRPLIFLDVAAVTPYRRDRDITSRARRGFASMAALNELILRSGAALVISSIGHHEIPSAEHTD